MTEPEQNNVVSLASLLTQKVVAWHEDKMNFILHLANVPDSESLIVTNNDTGEEENITGRDREMFIKGLLAGRALLLDLPFAYQVQEVNQEEST